MTTPLHEVAGTTVGQDRARHRSAGRALARAVAVAVVSDGSALHHHGVPVAPESVEPLLRGDATLIHDLTGLPVLPLPVSAQDAEQLADRLADPPAHIGVIFLTKTDPARARTAQRPLPEQGGTADVIGCPLHRIARTADVVIDLVGAAAQCHHARTAPQAGHRGPPRPARPHPTRSEFVNHVSVRDQKGD
jgi:hypothetical protein